MNDSTIYLVTLVTLYDYSYLILINTCLTISFFVIIPKLRLPFCTLYLVFYMTYSCFLFNFHFRDGSGISTCILYNFLNYVVFFCLETGVIEQISRDCCEDAYLIYSFISIQLLGTAC
jgi:hypothetical protein